MFKPLVVLSALVLGSASFAHADSINGTFSVFGHDSFTSSTINFIDGTAQPLFTGDFATYLTAGDTINFLTIPGGLPFHTGTNTVPNPPYTTGSAPLFTVLGNGGTNFTFNMTSYNATYDTTSPACSSGVICLDLTGYGFVTSNNPALTASGSATGATTLQYVSAQFLGTATTFSGQVNVSPAITPEPSSLALLGTGMLGVVGIARRKFKV